MLRTGGSATRRAAHDDADLSKGLLLLCATIGVPVLAAGAIACVLKLLS